MWQIKATLLMFQYKYGNVAWNGWFNGSVNRLYSVNMNTGPKPNEAQLIDHGVARLKEALPATWKVSRIEDPNDNAQRADAILTIGALDQAQARVVVEARTSFAPKDVDAVLGRARLLQRVAGDVPLLVVAPWFSERSRILLVEAGLNYLDLAGNVRLATNYPALFVYREPGAKAPKRRQSGLSLKGVKAGRLVRLLVDAAPPYSGLELARYAGLTAGYVSRLLEMLDREAIVERSPRGSVSSVDWRELLKRRAETYGVFTSNAITRYVCPNGPNYALEKIGDVPRPDIALTGSFPVERVVSIAPPSLLILYTRASEKDLVKIGGLLPADEGANVVIAAPPDPVIMEPRWPVAQPIPPRVPVVAASQLALDCLTGNGRMPQEGDAFLEGMGRNEDQWRFKSLATLEEWGSSS